VWVRFGFVGLGIGFVFAAEAGFSGVGKACLSSSGRRAARARNLCLRALRHEMAFRTGFGAGAAECVAAIGVGLAVLWPSKIQIWTNEAKSGRLGDGRLRRRHRRKAADAEESGARSQNSGVETPLIE
jgi:hypothetical protein